jgi:hypothetical protein
MAACDWTLAAPAPHVHCTAQTGLVRARPMTPQVPMSRLLALNRPDWPYGVVGFIAAGLSGCAQPAVAFLLAAFITVFYIRDMDELRRQVRGRGTGQDQEDSVLCRLADAWHCNM